MPPALCFYNIAFYRPQTKVTKKTAAVVLAAVKYGSAGLPFDGGLRPLIMFDKEATGIQWRSSLLIFVESRSSNS